MEVRVVQLIDIRKFIELNHYSRSVNGCKVSLCFGLYDGDELVGAALFGALSTTAWKRYGDREGDVVELRRLVCLDRCPRNTESWFIARCLKQLKRLTSYKVCISYADPYHGHYGVIYQASNWKYHGQTPGDILLKTPDGRMYHSRALRTKYKGDFKPFVKQLRALNDAGCLIKVDVPGKYIYSYRLDGQQKATEVPYPKPTGGF